MEIIVYCTIPNYTASVDLGVLRNLKTLMSFIQIRKSNLNSSRVIPIIKDQHVAKHPSHLHTKYVVVPADMPPNNVVLCVNHIT